MPKRQKSMADAPKDGAPGPRKVSWPLGNRGTDLHLCSFR